MIRLCAKFLMESAPFSFSLVRSSVCTEPDGRLMPVPDYSFHVGTFAAFSFSSGAVTCAIKEFELFQKG